MQFSVLYCEIPPNLSSPWEPLQGGFYNSKIQDQPGVLVRDRQLGWGGQGTELCFLERRIWPISLNGITLLLSVWSQFFHQQGHLHLGSVPWQSSTQRQIACTILALPWPAQRLGLVTHLLVSQLIHLHHGLLLLVMQPINRAALWTGADSIKWAQWVLSEYHRPSQKQSTNFCFRTGKA